MKPCGLYIHIPFCTQKCRYCDFYSITQNIGFRPYQRNVLFIERLLQDIRFFKERYRIDAWKTVYIGGGTPSLLHPEDMRLLTTEIYHSQTAPIAEFTIEANPEDIRPEWLAACSEGGINRLSLGVQSFDDAVLANSGRRGSRAKTLAALDTVKQRWPGALSCDLIAGLSGQTAASLSDDVRRLIDYRIEHLSLYGLCSEDALPESHEDFISELLQKNFALLTENGYVQYEVSNFSYHDEHRSLHNQIYWRMAPYIGIGPAACGTLIHEAPNGSVIGAERFEGIKNAARWMTAADRTSVYPHEHIDRKTLLEETLLMGFRLSDGIRREDFTRRFGAVLSEYIGKTLTRWKNAGHCRILPDRVSLTPEGLFFLNRFLIDAFLELDEQGNRQ